MKKTFTWILLIFFVLSALSTQNESVSAQESWDIQFNQILPIETPDSMTLRVYFTVFESHSGVPVMNAVIQSAQIALLNTNYSSNATVQKPDIPIYIALVMDASGSMGGSAAALKDAAKLSLNDIPDDSLFSVIQFDENIQLLQDFTKNIAAVSYAIDNYKVSNNGTCLYDAAYTAIEAMSKLPTGRRALILFTDGKDEKRDGSTCSQHRYQEMIDLAMTAQVPINTIGLSTKEANINTVELQAMAASTGGFSSFASKDDLPSAFSRIMSALKAQWMAEAVVYPKRGSNNAVLTLSVKDSGTLNAAFTVESETDYPGPPSPVSLNLSGLILNAAQQAYEVQLGVTSPQLVQYAKVEVWDVNGGAKVGEYTFEDLSEFNSFFIPTDPLTINGQYELRISAISKEDQTAFAIVRDSQGKTSTQLIHEFTFDPSSAYPTLEVQSVVAKGGDLVMNVSVTNPSLIAGFDGWLVNETTNTQVANSSFTSPSIDTSTGELTIPMRENRIKNGKYSVVIRVLSKNESVYSSVTIPGVTYKAPSIFSRIGASLIAQPLLLFGVVGIILIVVIFLMIYSSRQKSMTGTPVLQGRIGGKAGKDQKIGSAYIPVSEQEPIPFRQSNFNAPPLVGPPPVSPPPISPMQNPQVNYAPPAPPVIIPQAPTPVSQHIEFPTSLTPESALPVESPRVESAQVLQAPVGDETMFVPSRSQGILYPTITVIHIPTGVILNGPMLINQLPFTIGRTEGDLNIPDASISRQHLQITYDADQQIFFVTDLNSKNGTSINNQKITPGLPNKVTHGTTVNLGPNVSILFEFK